MIQSIRLNLDPATFEQLKACAKNDGLTMGDMARKFIAAGLDRVRHGDPLWMPISTLTFPEACGPFDRAASILWLLNEKTRTVMARRPIKRKRDGLIGVFAEDFIPTHWQPYVVPAAPQPATQETV